MMYSVHPISLSVLDSIARGTFDSGAVSSLRRMRVSRTLMLIRDIVSRDPELQSAADAFSRAQKASPTAGEEVLAYPWVAAWAGRHTRLRDGDGAHFRAVAAAALLRSGLDAPADLLTEPLLQLPGLGELASANRRRSSCGAVDLDGPGWRAVHRVECGHGDMRLRITVDDLDPYRDCHDHPVSERLDGPTRDDWTELITGAWRLLTTYAPPMAGELATGLVSMVPLRSAPDLAASITHADAFGGFATTKPVSPADLAVAMVHEFQHSKLNALMDVFVLCEPDARRYTVAWRDDPRPLVGVIHGLYAFTAVARLWSRLCHDPGLHDLASHNVATLRSQVMHSLAEVLDSPALTPAGARFLAGVGAAVRGLQDVRRRGSGRSRDGVSWIVRQ
ncbi:aKG-HExxH-type peptide beta-hydroxylase [Catellatospora sichuanensis]|uniref:aKG-HExxH-type peptide beta-hydroxylase n=1 Tax=Catellatospora sichuanensis TaxID=1969805 RepID=UPI00118234BA|nr:HEXXH motif-containing putative peptide modification protein [Catellatospora sichuanensis]